MRKNRLILFSYLEGKDKKQHGLDVFSKQKARVIQCKLKDISRPADKIVKELLEHLSDDFKAFNVYNKTLDGHFTKFFLASSFKDDTATQTAINKLKTNIDDYWSWNRLIRHIPESTRSKYYPNFDRKVVEYYDVAISETSAKGIPIQERPSPISNEQKFKSFQPVYEKINELELEINNQKLAE